MVWLLVTEYSDGTIVGKITVETLVPLVNMASLVCFSVCMIQSGPSQDDRLRVVIESF